MKEWKNPIPHLPEDEQCKKIKLCFSFKTPVTKEEAAENLTEYFKKHKVTTAHIIFDGEVTVRDQDGGHTADGT